MPWSRLNFRSGISKDITRYGSEGTWVDGSLVRFRNGFPERWGGWVRYLADFVMMGVCRSIKRWAALSGYIYIGLGTNSRFYVASDDLTYDVSPIRATAVLANPFATQNGSPIVTVTDASHGALVGQGIIISGAAAVGGLTLDGTYTISGYIDDDHYEITASSVATSTVAAGGGAAVTIQYIYEAGATNQVVGGGWGADTWGENEWGGSANAADGNIGLWTQDNWGQDLVACMYDGPIFYWFVETPTTRMVNIRDLPGADGFAPTLARFIVVSHKDRHLLAFGVGEEYMGSEYAPMTVRWCSQEDIYNWDEADETGTAGSLPLSRGSRFLAVQPTQSEILAWSDTSLYSLQFVGAPDVYIATIVSEQSDIAGLNASCVFGTNVFWMGRSGFYVYDGRVQKIPSTVWNYVYQNVNWDQGNKVYACTNKAFDEVVWYYPSVNSLENDSYVCFNVQAQEWTIGTLSRTAWLDMDFQFQPMAATADGELYFHEVGADDGSENPPIAIPAFIESAPIELSSEGAYDKGDRFAFMRRIIPDVTFLLNDGVNTPTMNMVIKTMDFPGGGFKSTSSSQVSQTAIIPVEEFTTECHVRLRGRSVTVRYESDTLGSLWRVGQPRFDLRSDGQR
jgi:hypothetical protein